MTEQAAGSPHSQADSNHPKAPAAKDRSCPFCHQAFTSSSLGRHLDQYIKPRNPKAPDGIHNVEQIREMRASITRRQARSASSKKEKEGSVSSGNAQGAMMSEEERQTTPLGVQSPTCRNQQCTNPKPDHEPIYALNKFTWHTTGVINDLPPRPIATAMQEPRKEWNKHYQLKVEADQRRKVQEELDNGKAAELALKEVLGSVREASARTAGFGIFDFDPLTLNFPGLCLRILPPPSTLFSPTPFSTSESWSINPPGQKQFEALQRTIRERLSTSTIPAKRPANKTQWAPSNPASPLPTPPLETSPQKLCSHLTDAFTHWKSLPEKQRQEAWQLELLRSYARADEARLENETSLQRAQREIESLKDQLEKMRNGWIGYSSSDAYNSQFTSTSSLPTSMNGHGHSGLLHLSNDTIREMMKLGLDSRHWDYDALMDKWKGILRAEKESTNGLEAQRPLSLAPIQGIANAAATGSNLTPTGLSIAPSRTFSSSTTIVQPSSTMDEDPREGNSSSERNVPSSEENADTEGATGSGRDGQDSRMMNQPRLSLPPPMQHQHPPAPPPLPPPPLQVPPQHQQHPVSPTRQQQQAPQWLNQQQQQQQQVTSSGCFAHVSAASSYPHHVAMDGVEGNAAAGFSGQQGMGLGLPLGCEAAAEGGRMMH